jgi:PAS domain S-box-containing protein
MLQAIFESALDAIVVYDDRGSIVDANPAACDLFQVPRGEIGGRNLEGLVSGAAFCSHLEAPGEERGEATIRAGDRRNIPVEYRCKRHFVPGSNLAVLREITERKRVEAELRASAEFLRRLIAASHDCIKVLDLEGLLVSINEGGCRLLGIDDPADFVGRPWVSLWEGGDMERAAAAVEEARGGAVARFDGYGLTAKGAGRWWETVIAPVNDDEGRPERMIAVSRDITDRVLAERERHEGLERMRAVSEQANRAKDEFIATLAHELRNPLGAIVNAVAALDAIGTATPPAKSARAVIHRQANHMARLLDDLLDVARIGERKIALRVEPVDLCAVVEAAIDGERPRLERKRHRVTTALRSPPVVAIADAVRMRQVASNLLNNACKYTPEGGAIEVAVAAEGADAVITVRDSGEGIPPERLDDIFGLFTQLRTGGHSEGGLGIGLTLVRRLVELQGGSIAARSEGPGKGSTFVARVPLAPAVPREAAAGRTTARVDPAG